MRNKFRFRSISSITIFRLLSRKIVHLPGITVETLACLQNWLTDLEIFATLVAAIIHDYEHTGTTNNFHVMSGSDTALLYNDRAVLENHHISASFRYVRGKRWSRVYVRSLDDCRLFSL